MRLVFAISCLVFTLQSLFADIRDVPYEKSSAMGLGKNMTTSQMDTTHFDVLHYRLDLDFPMNSGAFSGCVTMTGLVLKEGLSSIHLDMVDLVLDSVVSAGQLSEAYDTETLTMTWPVAFSAGDTFQFSVYYHGEPNEKGFYFYDRTSFTFSEPQDARHWFPCRDVPWDKATGEIIITVPHGYEAASNGVLISRTVSPANQTETFFWKTDYKMATYLFCVTISNDYAVWSDWHVSSSGDSIEMPYYIFYDDSANAVADNKNIKQALSVFSELFAPYPFEKYGIAEVTDDAPFGGMEHQTMTTVRKIWFQGNRAYEDGFVHELAHMWWGDAVTLTDWPDIWLNESFATYATALFREQFYGDNIFHIYLKSLRNGYLEQIQLQDFPVYNPPEDELFNWGIVYCKGALVLHQLRYLTGDTGFLDILQTYYQRYLYANASTAQFMEVCKENYGSDLDWFFDQWIYRKGLPYVKLNWYASTSPVTGVVVKIEQETDQLFKFPMELQLHIAGTIQDTTVWIENKVHIFSFKTAEPPDSISTEQEWQKLLIIDPDTSANLRNTSIPSDFDIAGNAPNPFNQGTQIFYDLPSVQSVWQVQLNIYDTLGRTVRTLVNQQSSPGAYWIYWDGKDNRGRNMPTGVYVARLSAKRFDARHKVMLVK